jgi:hypothetical protein
MTTVWQSTCLPPQPPGRTPRELSHAWSAPSPARCGWPVWPLVRRDPARRGTYDWRRPTGGFMGWLVASGTYLMRRASRVRGSPADRSGRRRTATEATGSLLPHGGRRGGPQGCPGKDPAAISFVFPARRPGQANCLSQVSLRTAVDEPFERVWGRPARAFAQRAVGAFPVMAVGLALMAAPAQNLAARPRHDVSLPPSPRGSVRRPNGSRSR